MRLWQKFKSVVNDDIFTVHHIYSAYRFELRNEKGQHSYIVDETGKVNLAQLVFRLINPEQPILSIELGKTYVDTKGDKWFAYMEQSSSRHRMIRVGHTSTIESFHNDGKADSIMCDVLIVGEYKNKGE